MRLLHLGRTMALCPPRAAGHPSGRGDRPAPPTARRIPSCPSESPSSYLARPHPARSLDPRPPVRRTRRRGPGGPAAAPARHRPRLRRRPGPPRRRRVVPARPTPSGLVTVLHTVGLAPGHTYAAWWVVFNAPGFCTHPSATTGARCGDADLPANEGDPRVGATMAYATGTRSRRRPACGRPTSRPSSPPTLGAWPPSDRGCSTRRAEVHLVLTDLGLVDPAADAYQIRALADGCLRGDQGDCRRSRSPCRFLAGGRHAQRPGSRSRGAASRCDRRRRSAPRREHAGSSAELVTTVGGSAWGRMGRIPSHLNDPTVHQSRVSQHADTCMQVSPAER